MGEVRLDAFPIESKEINNVAYKIGITEPIQLNTNSDRQLTFQAVNIQFGGEKPEEIISAFLFDNSDKQKEPDMVGYATFSLDRENSTATIFTNLIRTKKYEKVLPELPSHIGKAVKQSGFMEALKIRTDLKGKGLGKRLWLLSSLILGQQGIDNILINGDETLNVGLDSTSSFYQKMGAVPTGFEGGQKYQIKPNIQNNTEIICNLLNQK